MPGDTALARALALVRDLRTGCSWDRTQARATLLAGRQPPLPTLLMAFRRQERAAGGGCDWPDATGPMGKVKEEIVELERETGSGKRDRLEDELGDLLFAVVNLARKLTIDPGGALERANDKFTRRFEAVERLAAERGVELGRASLEELDRLWDETKAAEGGSRP